MRLSVNKLFFSAESSSEEFYTQVWKQTLRIFRGCRRTLGHNCFTKDSAYFSGVEYVFRKLGAFERFTFEPKISGVGYGLWKPASSERYSWLATGISSAGWLEYLASRFVLDESELPVKSLNLARANELVRH